MMRTATIHGRRHEGLRAVLSAVMVVTGMWLSGVVDRTVSESNVNEAIGDVDGVWTWVAESPAVDAWSDAPVVSTFEPRCERIETTERRASARHGRES